METQLLTPTPAQTVSLRLSSSHPITDDVIEVSVV